MPDYLPAPARLVLILVLAVVGFTVGPLAEKVQAWRNRHLWEGGSDGR